MPLTAKTQETASSAETQLIQQAIGLHQRGQLAPAKALYEQILARNPKHFDALHLLGVIAYQTGRPEIAVDLIGKAIQINPNFAAAYSNRGNALKDLKRLEEALTSFDIAIALKPDYAELFNNRGIVLEHLKRFEDAIRSYEKAIALKPDYAEAFNNRGNALRDLKRFEDAIASYEKAIFFKPKFAQALNSKGKVLKSLKRFDAALESFEKAITIQPDFSAAINNRGNALRELGRIDEAIASFDKVITMNPEIAEVFYNRANALKGLRRLDEAITSIDKAISLNLNFAAAYWNKSLLKLQLGEFLEGWELHEWRLQNNDLKENYYIFPDKIAWRGQSDLRDRVLLIYAEQGLGDVIQFCRYIPMLQSLGTNLVVEVPKSLVSLISTLPFDMTLVAKGDPLPYFDAYCPVMSLPLVFNTTVETIPAKTPYLFSDPQKVQTWQNCLGDQKHPRVGLVWSGSAGHQNDRNRSIDLRTICQLLDLPIHWHSLQKEYRQDDLEVLGRHPEIHQHQEALHDFSDTAALIECLDLVITVDTSVAHVAGALGKPVWILLPYMPDFRWLLDRDDSPWYPTARLFRQPAIGDWDSVLSKVRHELLSLASQTQSTTGI